MAFMFHFLTRKHSLRVPTENLKGVNNSWHLKKKQKTNHLKIMDLWISIHISVYILNRMMYRIQHFSQFQGHFFNNIHVNGSL